MKQYVVVALLFLAVLCGGCHKIEIVDYAPLSGEAPNTTVVDGLSYVSIGDGMLVDDGRLANADTQKMFSLSTAVLEEGSVFVGGAVSGNRLFYATYTADENCAAVYEMTETGAQNVWTLTGAEPQGMIGSGGLLYTAERMEAGTWRLRRLDISGRSSAIAMETTGGGSLYGLYECGTYLALLLRYGDAVTAYFYDRAGEKTAGSLALSTATELPVGTALNELSRFVYRNIRTNALCFYDIAEQKVAATTSLDTYLTHEYLVCRLIDGQLLMRDAYGVEVFDFASGQTYYLYQTTDVMEPVFGKVGNVIVCHFPDGWVYAVNMDESVKAPLFQAGGQELYFLNSRNAFASVGTENERTAVTFYRVYTVEGEM